ncbi:MAG: ferritin [Anaerolineales bacterium]|nr:ferritin [Anaerolineales bacterium]
MISETLQKAMNAQVTKEFYASQLYLAMSAHFEAVNLRGFAHWMRVQSDEERGHALRFFDYVLERGGSAELGAVDAPPAEFGAPIEIFKEALGHEQKVTASINAIYALALKENDYAAQAFLQWFVSEQVEEEANATEMIDRLHMAGDNSAALLMLDSEVKARA